ncbi:MAG: LPS assembly lipoprotein LptE [Rhizobiaceae bacterium]
MLSSSVFSISRAWLFKLFAIGLVVFGLSACQFRPLYGNSSDGGSLENGVNLSAVSVSQVNSRVAQQVRNHLIFLLDGGFTNPGKTHEAKIRVTWDNRQLASIQGVQDSTSGTITVTASYDLIELSSGKAIASGSRQANSSYDRTGQVFANERAERDAENRAAKATAESLRLAIASDLSKI